MKVRLFYSLLLEIDVLRGKMWQLGWEEHIYLGIGVDFAFEMEDAYIN